MTQFAYAMETAFLTQKGYGSKPDDFDRRVDGFVGLLQHLPAEKVIRAVADYLLNNDDIPSPNALKRIACNEREPWKPDWAYFVDIKQRCSEGAYLLRSERDYLEKCRDYAREKDVQVPTVPAVMEDL